MMNKRSIFLPAAAALLLAACGGGGDDSPGVAVTPAPAPAAPAPAPQPAPAAPPPVAAAPVAPAPPPPVRTTPEPETPPVSPTPEPAPAPAPNTPPPPPPPPQPAEGTYILGKVVKQAMASNHNGVEQRAYEVDPATGKASNRLQGIWLHYYTTATQFQQYTYPTGYWDSGPNAKYPYANVTIPVSFNNEGFTTLGRVIQTYSNTENAALVTDEEFVIRDDHKFILDTSAVTWRGVEGKPWFVQLQISSFHPQGATTGPASDIIFKLCLHQYTDTVRRLSCTLHERNTGEYRGVQVLDDSRGLGSTEYLPLNQ